MGIDHTSKQHKRVSHRTAPKSENVYLKMLVRLYTFLARMFYNYTPDHGLKGVPSRFITNFEIISTDI